MDINSRDKRYRYAKHGIYDISASWNDDKVVVKVNEKFVKATIFADTTIKSTTTRFGGLSHHSSSQSVWRPLTTYELNQVDETLTQHLKSF